MTKGTTFTDKELAELEEAVRKTQEIENLFERMKEGNGEGLAVGD